LKKPIKTDWLFFISKATARVGCPEGSWSGAKLIPPESLEKANQNRLAFFAIQNNNKFFLSQQSD